jgi:alpha-L-fucosidase
VDIFWFDGLGGTDKDWDAEKLIPMIRTLQPGIIINNRAGLSADFDTPEQKVGTFERSRAWESCITIGNQWAWKPDDVIKSARECIHTLVCCAGGDGNLLFNVGPMPTGEIEPRQVERLKAMGEWLGQYGDTIYGTRGGPYKPGSWGASTCKGNKVYLHIFAWPEKDLILKPIPAKVIGNKLITQGKVKVDNSESGLRIGVEPKDRNEIDTIVELELDKPAMEIPVMNGID